LSSAYSKEGGEERHQTGRTIASRCNGSVNLRLKDVYQIYVVTRWMKYIAIKGALHHGTGNLAQMIHAVHSGHKKRLRFHEAFFCLLSGAYSKEGGEEGGTRQGKR